MMRDIEKIFCLLTEQETMFAGHLDYISYDFDEEKDLEKYGEVISNDFQFYFLEVVIKYYLKLEKMLPKLKEEADKNSLNHEKVGNKKKNKEVFWLREISKVFRKVYNKPNHRYVADIVNIIFDTEYTEYDIANYTRKNM